MVFPDNWKTLRFLRLINRPEESRKCSLFWKKPCNKECMTQQQSPFHSGINVLSCWSMGCTNSSHSSCYFNIDSLWSPRTKPKALQRGYFDVEDLHLTDMLTVTKQKSEHFALNQLIPNSSDCIGSGTGPGLLSFWCGCFDSSNQGS